MEESVGHTDPVLLCVKYEETAVNAGICGANGHRIWCLRCEFAVWVIVGEVSPLMTCQQSATVSWKSVAKLWLPVRGAPKV